MQQHGAAASGLSVLHFLLCRFFGQDPHRSNNCCVVAPIKLSLAVAMPSSHGSIRLFRLAGIDVYLHWAWFIAAVYFINRAKGYDSPVWSVLECIALFGIVLMHEFGHAFACRAVGGKANQIVLWPLGGVAYVSPPHRPGAQLVSIAAGPMVNVVLAIVLGAFLLLSTNFGWVNPDTDLRAFLQMLLALTIAILVFNLLPIYPLDGGQILRSLLWFIVGPVKSLIAACVIGFAGVAGLVLLAVLAKSVWLGIMSVFVLASCWGGLIQARALGRIAKLPRRAGFACPVCKTPPPAAPLWRCINCGNQFDSFAASGVCPACGAQFTQASCAECGSVTPIEDWAVRTDIPPKYDGA